MGTFSANTYNEITYCIKKEINLRKSRIVFGPIDPERVLKVIIVGLCLFFIARFMNLRFRQMMKKIKGMKGTLL